MKSRSGIGGEQVEGRQAVRELLLAGRRRVQEVLIADSARAEDIEDLCTDAHVRMRRVTNSQLDAKASSDAPQGVVAFASPIEDVGIDGLFEVENPFVIALDGVTDPHNVGSIFRIGECAGATGLMLPKHRSAHVTATVAKASAGAVEYMPVALVSGVPAALMEAKKAGAWVAGLDPGGRTSIYDLDIAEGPIVLVLGAEGRGLAELTKKRCDVLVDIPQYGTVSSLNVSAAGAVACFEVARRRSSLPHS